MRDLILIVDDHPLVGEAFELSVGAAHPELEVGREASAEAAEAFARLHGSRIKLVLLDLMLPDATGFSALLSLQQLLPACPIAIVSARADAATVALARTFGVAAYLSKAAPVRALVEAVGGLLRGEAGSFPETPPPGPAVAGFQTRIATLSPAQLRVLFAAADGRLNKQIAGDMNLTEGTVKQHMSAIFKRLGVGNRSQAILAIRPYLEPMEAT
ncbi:response regulator transcription factor [soil metagenome]